MCKKFIIYSRRSKIRKDGSQHTHATAEWQVKQYLNTLDQQGIKYEIVDHVVEDISGYGYYTKRPLFTKVVERCKSDKSLTLLASKCDRIARDSWTGSELLKSINMVVATQPDADDLTLQIMFAISEKETKNISDRFRAMYQAKKARCEETGEKLEWGANAKKYLERKAEGKHEEAKKTNREKARQKLQPVADEVVKIIKYSSNSFTLDEISNKLNEQGMLTARNNPWTKATVSKLIKQFNIEKPKLNKWGSV